MKFVKCEVDVIQENNTILQLAVNWHSLCNCNGSNWDFSHK